MAHVQSSSLPFQDLKTKVHRGLLLAVKHSNLLKLLISCFMLVGVPKNQLFECFTESFSGEKNSWSRWRIGAEEGGAEETEDRTEASSASSE